MHKQMYTFYASIVMTNDHTRGVIQPKDNNDRWGGNRNLVMKSKTKANINILYSMTFRAFG